MTPPKHRELELFSLSWPVFVEMALMTLIGTLGLWMAGLVSPAAVAIFGLSNQIRLMLDRVFRVVAMGTSVLVTQHRGAGDEEGARELALAGFAAALWLGAAAMLLIAGLPGPLLRLMNLPTELMALAVPFTILLGVALVVESVNITMFSVLRAFTYTRDSMRLVMAQNALHVVVAFPLVIGLGPLPALGLMGLGWGMLASRGLVFLLLVAIWARRLHIRLDFSHALWVPRGPLRAIVAIGGPSAGEKISFRLCFMMTVAMVGTMGTEALATHAYAMTAMGLVSMAMNALGAGGEIIVGHAVGAGHPKLAHQTVLKAVRWGALATAGAALLAWLIGPWSVAHLSAGTSIAALLGSILLLEMVAAQGRNLNIVLMGGLRAAGDVHYPIAVSMVINLLVGVGLAWLLGVHLGWGLLGLWCGYVADECLRGAAMAWRWWRLGWTPAARRMRQRVLYRQRERAA